MMLERANPKTTAPTPRKVTRMGSVAKVKSDLGPVKTHVERAAEEIVTVCPYQIFWWWGAPGRGTGDHAQGLALDLMNYADGTTARPGPERRAAQNWVKAYVLKNRVRLGVTYVIADRKIASAISNPQWSWRTYTGSDPHTNHVHTSFKASHIYRPPVVPKPPEDEVTPADRKAIADDVVKALAPKLDAILARDQAQYESVLKKVSDVERRETGRDVEADADRARIEAAVTDGEETPK